MVSDFKTFTNKGCKIAAKFALLSRIFLFGSGLKSLNKKIVFWADFAMVETMLLDGLETYGQRVYC